MDVKELEVRMPFERLMVVANTLGNQDTDVCPPTVQECWLRRDLAPYLPASRSNPVDHECEECWLHFFLNGD